LRRVPKGENAIAFSTRALALAASIAPVACPSFFRADSSLELKGGPCSLTASQSISGVENLETFPASGDVELPVGYAFGLVGMEVDAGSPWTGASSPEVSGVPLSIVRQLRFAVLSLVAQIEAGLCVFLNTAKCTTGDLGSSTIAVFAAPFGPSLDFLLGMKAATSTSAQQTAALRIPSARTPRHLRWLAQP